MAAEGIAKSIVSSGRQYTEFQDGCKAIFHFKTCKPDGTVLDDSKSANKPMELLFGKKFKMPVWEECLRSMNVGEVAKFEVNKGLVTSYPFVSKSYRQFAGLSKANERSHCCGLRGLQEGLGHADLDKLHREPCDLTFTIELLSVKALGDYEKDSWAMNQEEKLESIPHLREEGNKYYKCKKYKEASEKYAEALNRLEQLKLSEKPGEEEWLELENLKIPLLLNYSQCKLIEKDYYAVIEHTTTVLKREQDNVKALFRRAKAHVGAWNPEEARSDFHRAMELDPTLSQVIKRELQQLDMEEKRKDAEDKAKLCGKVFLD